MAPLGFLSANARLFSGLAALAAAGGAVLWLNGLIRENAKNEIVRKLGAAAEKVERDAEMLHLESSDGLNLNVYRRLRDAGGPN